MYSQTSISQTQTGSRYLRLWDTDVEKGTETSVETFK